MAHPDLPQRVKLDIQDRFEAFNKPTQRALSTLGGIVGLAPSCNIDWNLLYTSLEENFPDQTTFVPTISDVVVAWCDVLSTRLEDERFGAWTEGLIGMLEGVGAIRLRLQVSDSNRPTTFWSADDSGFLLSFPRTFARSAGHVSPGFEADFASLFTSEPSAVSTESSLPFRPKEEEWAEMDEPTEVPSLKYSTPPMHADAQMSSEAAIVSDRIPSITALPMPNALFLNLTPYILHVTQRGSGKLIGNGSSRSINQGAGRLVGQSSSTQVEQGGRRLLIQGTHSPSLQFLYQYLQRWIKKDRQGDKMVPFLRITLHESHFGLGVNYDTLTIEPYDTNQEQQEVEMNPTIVIALIESVLGYRRLPFNKRGFWEFRRDTPFKR